MLSAGSKADLSWRYRLPASTQFQEGMEKLCLLLLYMYLLVLTSLCSTGNAAVVEGDALVKMLSQWTNVSFPTWQAGADPCTALQAWENVTCDSNGFVVGLNVSNRNIVGAIPPEIGDLVHLEVLDMGNIGGTRGKNIPNKNKLTSVPDSLASLTSLRVLNLSSVRNIPFPAVVTKIASLQELAIAETNLTGNLPAGLYRMPNLRTLYIGGNQFQNVDLKDFQTLTTLQELAFWGSSLNQTLPPELAKLTALTYMNFHDSNLYGPLPDWIGSLTKLNKLHLYNNALTGRIPDTLKALKDLSELRMDNDAFFEEFPMWLMTDLLSLQVLILSKNNLYGPMPPKSAFISRFTDVRLDCNYFTGDDPYPDENNTFMYRTKTNCFDGQSPIDQGKVVTNCNKPADCNAFRAIVDSKKCPQCPQSQNVLSKNPSNNPCICSYGGGPKGEGTGVPVGAVVGGALGLLVVFCVLIGLILWKKREQFAFMDKFKVKKEEDLGDWEIPAGVERFTLQDLAKITDNFNEAYVIGAGGFGKVFRGSLEDGRVVAIKRASPSSMQGSGEFRNEITLLSRLHHRHLVRLEGFCDEEDLQILVYEFMKKGNLHSHLLGQITSTPLHWYKRLEIAVGVAQGLEYLHSFADPPVIHRDVKPSNILLDENMVAKLADFGISKATAEFDTHVSTRPAGTAGYLDPEYFLRRQLTTASDVYSFGVVLLELVTGQEAIDHKRHEEYNLIEWSRKRFKTSGIASIIDPLLEYEYSREAYTAMTELALLCASFNKDERPNMKAVLASLEPHLAIQSLYGPKSVNEQPASDQDPANPDQLTHAEASTKPSRPVYITFESEYLDTSIPTEVGTNLKMVSDNLRPR